VSLCVRSLQLAVGGRRLLDDVSVSFQPGRVTALVGPNGAGKSTLLSCLAGLRSPDRGEVELDGRPLAIVPTPERARRLALLPQGAEIHWNIAVRALVELGRAPWRGAWGVDERDDGLVGEAMNRADVAHLAERQALTLSGGERGRALLARALAVGAPWLLADEPLAGLDPLHQLTALAALRAEAALGTGVVLVVHDLSLAARHADHIVVLHKGRVAADGTPEAVLTPLLLRDVYGVEAHVGRTPDGALLVQPLRAAGE
jgi:iron complex transport system ATP-binding protein